VPKLLFEFAGRAPRQEGKSRSSLESTNLRAAVQASCNSVAPCAPRAKIAEPGRGLRSTQRLPAGRPGPRRRLKAAHFLLTSSRCEPITASGWTSIPTSDARPKRRLSAAMIVRSAMSSCGLFTWRRTTRSWWRRSSNSASGSRTRSRTSKMSRSRRSTE